MSKMIMINTRSITLPMNQLEDWAKKVSQFHFHELHSADELFSLFITTPASVGSKISVMEEPLVVENYSWDLSGATDGHTMMVALGGMWDGEKWHREAMGDKIKHLLHKCLKTRLMEKWECSFGQACMMEEAHWVGVTTNKACGKKHKYERFGVISVTCCNMSEHVETVWVEGVVGSKNHGDITGGALKSSVLKIGIGSHVSYPACGHYPEDLVQANALAMEGLIQTDTWYRLVREILDMPRASNKQIDMAFTGGKRKMGIRKKVEWKAEDLLDQDGNRDEKRVSELKHGKNMVDGKSVGAIGYMGRLRSKQSKIRSDVDGKLKGVRVNGMRTERADDWSQDGWFKVYVDGKSMEQAQSCKDVMAILLTEGEVPDWKLCGEDVMEMMLEEYGEWVKLSGGLNAYEMQHLGALAIEKPEKPIQVLLMLALAMRMRDRVRVKLGGKKRAVVPKRLKVDLMGGEGRVDIELWRKQEFGEVKEVGVVGEALWEELVRQVNEGKEPLVPVAQSGQMLNRRGKDIEAEMMAGKLEWLKEVNELDFLKR